MIKLIDMSGQITEEGKDFAFFCTVKGRFLTFEGEQVFDSIEEFKMYYEADKNDIAPDGAKENIERYLSKITNQCSE